MKQVLLLSSLLFVSSLSVAQAEDSDPVLSSEQQHYINQYIAAINSDSAEDLTTLMHPAYRQCMTPESQDFYDDLLQKSLKRTIPEDYKVVFEKSVAVDIEKEMTGAEQRGFPYPVAPTHQLQIDYSTGEYAFTTIVRKLVLEQGRYYEVSGCPTPELLVRYRELQLKKAQEQKRAEQLFAQLQSPLLDELKQLLQQGQKIQAWKRYSAETGESLGTAKAVLSQIKLQSE